ncbi:hypothetical protein [Paraferrimonas haliotis]|nr:hypothetical protein [Paraferrimonas haliotis]
MKKTTLAAIIGVCTSLSANANTTDEQLNSSTAQQLNSSTAQQLR